MISRPFRFVGSPLPLPLAYLATSHFPSGLETFPLSLSFSLPHPPHTHTSLSHHSHTHPAILPSLLAPFADHRTVARHVSGLPVVLDEPGDHRQLLVRNDIPGHVRLLTMTANQPPFRTDITILAEPLLFKKTRG